MPEMLQFLNQSHPVSQLPPLDSPGQSSPFASGANQRHTLQQGHGGNGSAARLKLFPVCLKEFLGSCNLVPWGWGTTLVVFCCHVAFAES